MSKAQSPLFLFFDICLITTSLIPPFFLVHLSARIFLCFAASILARYILYEIAGLAGTPELEGLGAGVLVLSAVARLANLAFEIVLKFVIPE